MLYFSYHYRNVVKVNLDDDTELTMDISVLNTYLQSRHMTFESFRSETPLTITVDLDGKRIQKIHEVTDTEV